jgi:histidinol-phosphate/aromatic aminotransferase/cobyric acid decarboxylase-like protein
MTTAAAGRLRVSIGSRAENDLFLEALREVL